MIRHGAKSDVEFAGHYTVPRWGCGTECKGFVVADSISGKPGVEGKGLRVVRKELLTKEFQSPPPEN
jgi:hypothetical protein